jgi:hypothetical protein
MTRVREWRPAQLVMLWVGALAASVMLYFALGAVVLMRGPLPGPTFIAVAVAPLIVAAWLTWTWFATKEKQGRA